MREAFYGLDRIAVALDALRPEDTLEAAMERLMLAEPGNWARYYPGTPDEQRLQRHFSYSDRIRYYWPHPEAVAAVGRLLARLDGRRLPETLISQYLGPLYPAVAAGRVAARGPTTSSSPRCSARSRPTMRPVRRCEGLGSGCLAWGGHHTPPASPANLPLAGEGGRKWIRREMRVG